MDGHQRRAISRLILLIRMLRAITCSANLVEATISTVLTAYQCTQASSLSREDVQPAFPPWPYRLMVTVVALAVTDRSSALESTNAPRSGFM